MPPLEEACEGAAPYNVCTFHSLLGCRDHHILHIVCFFLQTLSVIEHTFLRRTDRNVGVVYCDSV